MSQTIEAPKISMPKAKAALPQPPKVIKKKNDNFALSSIGSKNLIKKYYYQVIIINNQKG